MIHAITAEEHSPSQPSSRPDVLQWARDSLLMIPLVEYLARQLLMAFFTIVQSRLRDRLGDERIVQIGRAKMALDLRAMHDVRMYWSLSRRGGYEPETSQLLAQLLRPGDTFVDVGANNGYFAVLASQYVGPSGNVIAIEPNPTAVERLTRNAELNKAGAPIWVLPIALSNADGEAMLYVAAFEDGWGSLVPFPDSKPPLKVRVSTLDSIVPPTESVVLKVDAEGGEKKILEGMSKLLERSHNIALILEWNHLFGTREMWDYLHTRFRVYHIVPSSRGNDVTLHEVTSWEELRNVFLKNILLTSGPRWAGRDSSG